MYRLVIANEKSNSEFLIARNINQSYQNRTINLEKQQSKLKQCNSRNSVEVSGISNEVLYQNLQQILIGICKDS